jgi:DNA-binding XRE family transcriptional regulator
MGLHIPTETAFRELGLHLGRTRSGYGVTQEFLAHWIGVNRTTLQRIERGNSSMRVAHLSAIETALALRPGTSFGILAGVQRPGHIPGCPPTLVDLSETPTLCGHNPPCRPGELL